MARQDRDRSSELGPIVDARWVSASAGGIGAGPLAVGGGVPWLATSDDAETTSLVGAVRCALCGARPSDGQTLVCCAGCERMVCADEMLRCVRCGEQICADNSPDGCLRLLERSAWGWHVPAHDVCRRCLRTGDLVRHVSVYRWAQSATDRRFASTARGWQRTQQAQTRRTGRRRRYQSTRGRKAKSGRAG